MLLVHGFASSYAREWIEPGWVDLLSDAGRRAVGSDLPGHGSAPKPHDPRAYDNLEQVVLDWLPPGPPADAIAFSLGARVLLRAASLRPTSFRRVVVAGAGQNLLQPEDRTRLADLLDPPAHHPGPTEATLGLPDGDALLRFATDGSNDPLALAALLRRRDDTLSAADLDRVRLPVLVILGDRDFNGPPEPLVTALPQASLTVLAGVDHLATARHLGFIDAALTFLEAES